MVEISRGGVQRKGCSDTAAAANLTFIYTSFSTNLNYLLDVCRALFCSNSVRAEAFFNIKALAKKDYYYLYMIKYHWNCAACVQFLFVWYKFSKVIVGAAAAQLIAKSAYDYVQYPKRKKLQVFGKGEITKQHYNSVL